jgi:3-oxoacyl-[acyl-carrier protein] reductase
MSVAQTEEQGVTAGGVAGRVIIVTGAGHGIGRGYARRLAREGAKVVVADVDGAGGQAVADEITAAGFVARAIRTDVTRAEEVRAMAAFAAEEFGRIDVLVNNAALFATIPMSRSPFDEIEVDEWDRMMAINLRGPWLASRAVFPMMKRQGYGKIINISSGTALKGSASRIHYVTSKAGILGFTKTLAREVGTYGIMVNCVAPGSTLSEESPDEETLKMRASATADRAIQRVQRPEDLEGAIIFFASSASDFITGQTLVVDGGSCMH